MHATIDDREIESREELTTCANDAGQFLIFLVC